MWTNVFRIGGLHQLSWFQFLPQESDLNPQQDRSFRGGQKDASMLLVLSAHLLLQKQGFLSAWTNSFVGPWDPSQGVYNPDEKIKLWLFLPGRRSSVVETAQTAVSKLRVVNSGLWLAPGDSEDVAAALSQALRNCIERALIGGSYMRFGDVFSRIHPFAQGEELFRRRQPTIEFIFAATEEAIFVHVIVSAKHIRPLSSGDMERVLKCSSNNSNERLSVIVSPHGIRGKLTGVCPSDLVKQVYFRSGRVRTSNGFAGLPYNVSQGSTGQLRGQNCYVEVTVGVPRNGMDKAFESDFNHIHTLPKHHAADSPALDRNLQKGSQDNSLVCERTFIYPAEAILVPILQTSFARSSLKRFWLQNWTGPSLTGSSVSMHWMDPIDGQWNEQDGIPEQHSYDSSSNSNNSSISSISGNSSDSDYKMTTRTGDLEADADSLTCRQSGRSSNDQGSKRPRGEMLDSYGQLGIIAFKSDYGSASADVGSDPLGSQWVWDEEDNGVCIDMQTLVSEFGDFGDLFENDSLPFGEPPGTAESQALMFTAPDSGEIGVSPSAMDVSDQMLLNVGFPSFESYNPPSTAAMEECLSKNEELLNNTISGPVSCTPPCFTGELDHLMKAEALMTFAPEYGAIETPATESSSSIFKSPYIPKSKHVESSNSSTQSYVYGATPPSPCLDLSHEKPGMPVTSKACRGKHNGNASVHPKSFYSHVDSGIELHDRKLITSSNSISSCEGGASSVFNATNPVNSLQQRTTEGELGGENLHLSLKTVLATEVECVMFQAFMCRIRHTLSSSGSLPPIGLSKLTGRTGFNQLIGDPSTMTDNISSKYEIRKKEAVPVRIAGDMDGGVLDGPLNAPVGVWRSVAGPKGGKSSNIEACKSLPYNSFNEDGMLSYTQRQPLQELLDGMALLVQQATSFVDVALDSDCGDGPYGWLALQEQCRRGFSCGPYMVHAGCGGSLASCHSLDIAGMELIDPLSVEVHASSVISLLQSDIKTALKSAFGNVDGPLSVPDWCKGCGQLGDTGIAGDVFAADSTVSEGKDSLGTSILTVGESRSPSQTSAGGLSSLKDGGRMDETNQRRNQETSNSESEQLASRLRPSLFLVPLPSILVGYQDDWLKTSASSLQLWEKAPFEPYAQQKHMTYYVICPDIDPLTSAATDFFQQLGTVYSTCNLGNHSPERLSNQMDIDSEKWSSSGFLLLDCPQSMKMESSNTSLVGSISDYLLSLSNGWDLTSFLTSLSKVLKTLKLGSSSLTVNSKDGSSGLCTVIYIVCPFSEPAAILQTVIESSVTIGSIIFSSEKDRRSIVHSQVGKALSCAAVVDEASSSSILTLSGFSLPKLVLQVVTVDAIFRVTNPPLNELVILKEIAFAVYNKARRISRGSTGDAVQSSSLPNRSHPVLMQMTSPMSGMWKDCVGQHRIGGASRPREGELDASLRPGTWDGSWQTNRSGDFPLQDDIRYMFEPLFILAEPGSLEHGVPQSVLGNTTSDSSKPYSEDSSMGFMQSASSVGIGESGPSSQLDGSESESSSHSKGPPSLHCCYGWTEDWRWLVCIWTDSRGELLDSHIFPFGGISSRQDTKGLQYLFVQVLQQGCQILQACCADVGAAKPRDFVITRIGCFYELECQEWQKAIYSIGGSDVKKWPLHLRRSVPDRMPSRSNGTLLQQQEMSLIQERALPSGSPLYSSHSKSSGFAKGGLGQPAARKQLVGGSLVDSSRGLLQWVQSISLVAVSIDHSLYLISQADSTSPGGTQVSTSTTGQSGYVEGFSPVRSLDSTSASCIIIPSPSMRFLSPTPLQLPSCLTAESPPLAHLLHSKGSAIPFSTGFVVSKAVPSMRKDSRSNSKEEWPSVLSVGLVDYYGGTNTSQEKNGRGINTTKQGGRSLNSEVQDFEIETHLILESVAAELHALSWMTVSPAYLERRTALPSHCDMVLRLRRLLHYADKELFRQSEKS